MHRILASQLILIGLSHFCLAGGMPEEWLWGSRTAPPVAAPQPAPTKPVSPADLPPAAVQPPPSQHQSSVKETIVPHRQDQAGAINELDRYNCRHANAAAEVVSACTALIESKALPQVELAWVYSRRSYAYVEQARLDLARKDAEAAMNANPDAFLSDEALSVVKSITGKVEELEADYSKTLQEEPRNAEVLLKRAYARQARGDFDGAVSDITEAIKSDPKSGLAYRWRGELLSRAGKYDAAIADFTRSQELEPKSHRPFVGRGLAYMMAAKTSQDMRKAHEDLEKAIAGETEKSAKIALLDLRGQAWSEFRILGTDQAIRDYRAILKLDPANEDAHRALARLGGLSTTDTESDRCISEHDDDLRIAACTSLIERGTLRGQDLAAAYFQRGRTKPIDAKSERSAVDGHKAALNDLDRAVTSLPDVVELLYVHALFSVAAGDDVAAQRDYDKIVAVVPNDPWAHFVRHSFLLQIGDSTQARAALAQAEKLAPFHDPYKSAVKEFDKSAAASRVNNTIECTTNTNARPPELTVQYCTRAINYAGDASTTRSRILRGLAFSKLQLPDKAITDFSEIIRGEPNNAEALRLRGLHYAISKNWSGAYADFDAVVHLKPQSDEAYVNRGTALNGLGRGNEAATDFRTALKINPNNAAAKEVLALATAPPPKPVVLGRCDDATDVSAQIAACTKIIDNSGERVDRRALAYIMRGQAWQRSKKTPEALADFDQAITLGFVSAFALRGILATQARLDDNRAMSDLTKAIDAGVKLKGVFYWRGVIYRDRGDYRPAIEDFSREIEINPSADIFLERASCHLGVGDLERAEADIKFAMAKGPTARGHAVHGALLETRGDRQGAVMDYQAALRLDPGEQYAKARLTALGATSPGGQ